jgi:hypothetical protein
MATPSSGPDINVIPLSPLPQTVTAPNASTRPIPPNQDPGPSSAVTSNPPAISLTSPTVCHTSQPTNSAQSSTALNLTQRQVHFGKYAAVFQPKPHRKDLLVFLFSVAMLALAILAAVWCYDQILLSRWTADKDFREDYFNQKAVSRSSHCLKLCAIGNPT